MCEICGQRFCPSACPSYDGRSAAHGERIAICALCGGSIYDNERFFSNGARDICRDCADQLGIDELRLLCRFENTYELLTALGFESPHQ